MQAKDAFKLLRQARRNSGDGSSRAGLEVLRYVLNQRHFRLPCRVELGANRLNTLACGLHFALQS